MSFKVGDKVMISQDSEYYGSNFHNPADVVGTVICSLGLSGYTIEVEWGPDNGNIYRKKDLVLADRRVKITPHRFI